jgi:hypothetical protein
VRCALDVVSVQVVRCTLDVVSVQVVRCTWDVVSVQVVRLCKGGSERGGDFILCYGKIYLLALSILEVLMFCVSTVIGCVRLI